MPSVAITGSIGSGKSMVTSMLSKRLPSVAYSADHHNTLLLESDPEVRIGILSLFGHEAYGCDGKPHRSFLRKAILSSPELKQGLEEILHPRLRSRWESLAKEYRGCPDRFLIAEMPLLFENNLADRFDVTVVVASSPGIREERLTTTRSLSSQEIRVWMANQHPQEDKITAADHVIWNDGSLASVESQVEELASLLTP